MTRPWRRMLEAILVGACALLLGCSGNSGKDSELRKTIEDLKAENAALKKAVEQHEKELRPLQKRVDDHEVQIQDQDRTLGKVRKELESKLTELVSEQFTGRGRGALRAGRPFPGPDAPPAAPPPRRFEERAWMGFDGQDLQAELAEQLGLKAKTGVVITDIRDGSPAAQAGLKKNDVVQSLDDTEIKSRADLERAMQGKRPLQNVTVGILRDADVMKVTLRLSARQVPVPGPE